MTKNWGREVARDVLALGGIPFYLIVIARATIGKYNVFVYQLLIAIAAIYIIQFFIKKSNLRIARGFVLFIFTSLFYQDFVFTVFAFLLWLTALAALFYLKEKISNIIKGVMAGIVSAAIGYYVSSFLG
jgi:hypothetical protein